MTTGRDVCTKALRLLSVIQMLGSKELLPPDHISTFQ